MSAFNKIEYELYAPLAMISAFPFFEASFKKGECPDWWDSEHDIGLEIARAEDKHIGYTKFFWNKYRGKNKTEIPNRELTNFKGSAFFDTQGKLSASSDSMEMVDGDRHIKLAVKKSEEKLELLQNKHFRRFKHNFLLLYVTMSVIDDDAEVFLRDYRLKAKEYQNIFDHVFLLSNGEIHSIDIVDARIKRFKFSEEQIREMDNMVHQLSKAAAWDEGTGFLSVLKEVRGCSQDA